MFLQKHRLADYFLGGELVYLSLVLCPGDYGGEIFRSIFKVRLNCHDCLVFGHLIY